MTIRDRDKKILMALIPAVLVLGFWFLILAPKRAESGRLGDQLTEAEAKRDTAVSAAGNLEGARNSYAKDYETVVRLGKAVPASLDMPSLLVQLEAAAKGTNIEFDSVKAGTRTAAAPAAAATGSSGSAAPPAAAGGAPAQTGAGKATEKAGEAKDTADQRSGATGGTTAAPAGAAATGGAANGAAPVAGLDSVPLEFAFTGGFFDLADFFHRMKRFVHLTNRRIRVQGRLITIDNMEFKSETFPELNATVKATVYLSPKEQGTTAGATPAGPQTTQPAAAPGSTPSTAPTSGAP